MKVYYIIITTLLIGLSNSVAARHITVPNYKDLHGVRLSSVECLAVNLYHESRSESDIANLLVVGVVFNRVNDRRYPNDICEVVFQNKQFSWTSDSLSDGIENEYQYKRLYKLAENAIINKEMVIKLSEGVTHYHTTAISPYWKGSKGIKYITTIDNHIFYRWEG